MSTRRGELSIRTLDEGAQSAEEIGGGIAAWIGEAHRTLDLALYDVRVPGPVGDTIAAAIEAARARGVRVRIAIHDPRSEAPDQPTTPPQTRPDLLAAHGRRRAPDRRRPRPHASQVRRARRRGAVVRLDELDDRLVDARGERDRHGGLAAARAGLRAHLRGSLAHAGGSRTPASFDTPAITIGDALVRPWFCPGRGRELAHQIATRIDRARRRIRIASPVLTSAPVLAALAEVLHEGRVSATGVVDITQTEQALAQWRHNEQVRWKAPVLEEVLDGPGLPRQALARPTGPTASTTSCTRRSR